MPVAVEELFERFCQRGDVTALAQVFDRTAPEIWRVGRHLCGNRSEADDLLQATFLAAMESAARWRRSEALVPWLLGILANKLRMARRRDRRALPAAARPAVTVEDPVSAAERGELRELLQQRVGGLPEPYRSVLVLQLDHGLSAAEVAHALGRPRATVRSQLHRGLELLRRVLPAGLLALPGRAEGPPDLRAVRTAVLAAAGPAVVASAVGVGVAVMSKKLLVVPALVLLAAVFWAWPAANAEPRARAAATADPTMAASPSPEVAHAPAPEELRRSEIAAVPATTTMPALLRVHVTWSDGSPAAAMPVVVQPAPRANWFAQRFATADARGIATFTGLAPGKVKARARHGGGADAEVAPGHATDVDLCIGKGIDARGRVLAPDGQPIAGASVALGSSSEDLLDAARTDGNGAFFLRALDPKTMIAAFADGYAWSPILSASEFAGGVVDLKLTGKGGSVIGRVFDNQGLPLAAAWVSHGYVPEPSHGADGKVGPLRTSMGSALTDAAGEFRLHGVPLGHSWPLHAGAADHATWKGEVRAKVDEAVFVEIRLSRAVSLRGTVRDTEARPVRGFVFVVDGNTPPEGIGDQRPWWCRAYGPTREDGRYEFTNLVAGILMVSANEGGREPCKVASRSFTAEPGESLNWDPVLHGDLVIQGLLLDHGGSPLAGWTVRAKAPHGAPTPKYADTASDGSFTLTPCAAVPHRVTCAIKGRWPQAVLERRGVEPGGEPLVLRVPREAVPSCFVTGRLDPDQPDGEVSVVLTGERGGSLTAGPLRPGETFAMGPVPPGRYAFNLQGSSTNFIGWSQVSFLGECRLQPGQRHDLGEVRAPEPGELALELTDAQGRPVAKAQLWLSLLFGAPVGGVRVQVAGGQATAKLSPGTWLPSFCTDGVHIEHAPIVITAKQRTEVRLQLATAVSRRVCYDLSEVGVPLRASGVFKKDGAIQQGVWFSFWQEDRPTTIDTRFTSGAWELELELGTGSVQRFPFFVSADETGPDITIKIAK